MDTLEGQAKLDAGAGTNQNPPRNPAPISRYYGVPSDFRSLDRFGRRINWEPLKSLGQDQLPEDVQVYIGNLPPPTSQAPLQPLTLTFKNPARVKGIHFDGVLSQLQFEILAVPLVNLKTLELHLSALAGLTLKHTLIRLDLLTNLKISSLNFGLKDVQHCDMDLIFTNAIFLINIHFPSLKYLALSVPTLISKEAVWTEGVVQSLLRNKRSLQSLNLESPFPILEADHPPAEAVPFEFPRRFEREAKEIKLTTFHYFVTVPTASLNFWRKFSLTQTSLEYFHFWVECPQKTKFPVPSLEDILKNNRATIQTVAVSQLAVAEDRSGAGPVLNGSAFQHCLNLKTLYIVGDAQPESRIGQMSSPSFKYFNLLPYSIETLRIHNMMLSLSDTKFITNNLQNLKHLQLVNIGEDEVLGMSVDCLSTVMSKKTLERVEIIAGVNQPSLEPTTDDRGWKNIAKILFQNQHHSWFRAGRNLKTKVFEIIESEDESSEDDDSDDGHSDTSGSEVTDLVDMDRSTAKHQIHDADDASRILNSNARKLYGNVKFSLATSSDHFNQND